MNHKTIAAGVFPDVAAVSGLTWVIARLGDPRTAGHVAILFWEATRLDLVRELWRVAVPAGSPAFPRIYLHRGALWFAYHDGSIGILRNATTGDNIILAPCQNNDPICFGGDYVAWQGAAADGWPITRMHLGTRQRVAAGFGQGTGLSRVLDDGQVITVDTDRTIVPGGTRPDWSGDLVVIEKHGNRGALARLTDGREAFIWPDVQIITPRCAFDAALGGLCHVVGWSESDGQIRAAVLTLQDFARPGQPPPDPPPPDPPPPPEPPTMPELDIVKQVRAKYPTPLGGQHAAFLLDCAKTLGKGAGLLRKDSGTNILLPDGVRVAQDIICYPTGRIFDILRDGEGAAEPTWGEANGSPVEASRYYAVGATPPPPPPPDPPPPDQPPTHPPPVDLSGVIARLDAIDRKLADLAKPRTYAVKSAHGYLSIQGDSRMEWNRDSVGGWEQLRVEPQE